MVLNLVLNLMLVRWFGYRGLALGTALAAIFNAALLAWLLRARLGGIDGRRIATAFGKVTLASGVMAAAVWGFEAWLASVLPAVGFVERFVHVGAGIALGMATLGVAARLLRIAEFDAAVGAVMRKVFPTRERAA